MSEELRAAAESILTGCSESDPTFDDKAKSVARHYLSPPAAGPGFDAEDFCSRFVKSAGRWFKGDPKERRSLGEIINEFTAELRAAMGAGEDDGWRPIETAPKDDRVVVYCTLRGSSLGGNDRGKDYGKHVVIAAFDTHYGLWIDGSQCDPKPSHWRPLPAAPSEGKGAR